MPPQKKLVPLKRLRTEPVPGDAGVALDDAALPPAPLPDERKVAWAGGAGAAAPRRRAASPPHSPVHSSSSLLTGEAEEESEAEEGAAADGGTSSPGSTTMGVAARDYITSRRKAGKTNTRTAAGAVAASARAAWADLLRAEPADVAAAAAALEAGPGPRAAEKAGRAADLEAQFPAWREWMRRGASVMLYGFGSKRALLDAFAASTPTGGVLVVDGGAPGASARSTVLAAARALGLGGSGPAAACAAAAADPTLPFTAGAGFGPGARRSLASALASLAAAPPFPHLTLVVHGIDRLAASGGGCGGGGGGGGAAGDAAALAALAACPPVRLLASADHVNAPLLWDAAAAAAAAWRWVDATTLAPYSARAELGRLPPLDPAGAAAGCLAGGAGPAAAAAAAASVLASLVPHARAVFALIAAASLDGGGGHGQQQAAGIGFDDLFAVARARFLTPSEAALRGHVGEFRDHGLVVGGGRSSTGGEVLVVPLAREAIARVLAGLEEDGLGGGGGGGGHGGEDWE